MIRMTIANQPITEHQDIWEMLPWLVNERLSDPDRQRAEAHLRQCDVCRSEFTAQRRIQQVMAADSGVEQMPLAGLNRLRRRIENLDTTNFAHDLATDAPRATTAGAARWAARTGSIAAGVAGVAIALGLLGVRLWNSATRRSEPARYHTVTTAAPQPANAAIRAVFAPTVTMAELTAMLDGAQLRIVAGPTEAGVYTLAQSGSQSVDWSLRRLRGEEGVRFAEPLAAAPVAPHVR